VEHVDGYYKAVECVNGRHKSKATTLRSDVFFQGFFHANGTAKAFILIWTPKGGHEV